VNPDEHTIGCDEHFSDEMWIGFHRGLLPHEQTERMQEHANRHCAECLQSLRLWRNVVNRVHAVTKYRAPQKAVSDVKAAFALKQRVPLLSRFAQAARLVFDSVREPLPEGIRARVAAPRQFTHAAGRFLIDLRAETEGGRQTCVTGQIVRADGTEGATAGTGIALVREAGELVTMSIANSIGEFYLEFKGRRNLTLYLDVPGNGTIMVSLPQLGSGSADKTGTPAGGPDGGDAN